MLLCEKSLAGWHFPWGSKKWCRSGCSYQSLMRTELPHLTIHMGTADQCTMSWSCCPFSCSHGSGACEKSEQETRSRMHLEQSLIGLLLYKQSRTEVGKLCVRLSGMIFTNFMQYTVLFTNQNTDIWSLKNFWVNPWCTFQHGLWFLKGHNVCLSLVHCMLLSSLWKLMENHHHQVCCVSLYIVWTLPWVFWGGCVITISEWFWKNNLSGKQCSLWCFKPV